MDDAELGALTNQPVTISLGGKEYTADRLTLYHVGQYNRYREERMTKGDVYNLDIDSVLFLLAELIKPHHPEVTAETLAKAIPFACAKDLKTALEAVGFTNPQATEAKAPPTGEKSTRS